MKTVVAFPYLCTVGQAGVFYLLLGSHLFSQALPTPPPDSEASSPPVIMNPFTVTEGGNVGYLAQSSLSGSRLNTNMGDLAVPATAFTAEFIEDVGLRSIDELAVYMPSTEIAYQEANTATYTDDAASIRIRGLPATNTINYFPSNLRLDVYNTSRVDQSRGPNSILFGLGSPGGVVNLSPNRADSGRSFGSATVAVRTFDGLRTVINHNQALIKDRLAVRLDAVRDHGGTWRYNEYDHQDRLSLAIRFNATSRTVIDGQFEYGRVEKSITTPSGSTDAYTLWAAGGKRLSATPVAAAGIVTIGAGDYLSVDTESGIAWNMRGRVRSQPTPVVAGVGVVPYITDFDLLPKRTAIGVGPSFAQDTKYTRGSLFVAHSFTPNLNIELAGNVQNAPRTLINGATMNQIFADPNPTLPNGQPNPNAGRAYVEGFVNRHVTVDRAQSLRGTISYTKDFGGYIGKHSVAALWETDWTHTGLLQERMYIVDNPYNRASPENATNTVRFRTYIDLDGPAKDIVAGNWQALPLSQLLDPVANRRMGADFVIFAPGASNNRYQLDSAMAVLQSQWLNNRLITVVGVREDRQKSYLSAVGTRGPAVNGFTLGPYIVGPRTPMILDEGRNTTYSALFRVTKWSALTFNKAGSFSLAPGGFTSMGRAPNPVGRSQDYGIKIDLAPRFSFSATYFETSDNKGFRTLGGLGAEQLFKSIWPALDAAGIRAPDGSRAADNVPVVGGYTFNTVTTGYEFELIANPTPRWRLYFNATSAKSEDTNLGTETIEYYGIYRDFWRQHDRVLLDGSGGLAPVADNGNGIVDTVGKALTSIESQILNMYTLAEGQRPRGQIPMRYAVRTNYSFRESGIFKGFSLGGGLRYQDGQVTDFRPATTTTPALVQYGRDNTLVDLNFRFGRPARWLGHRVNWSVQLNINNALDETDILPLRVSPTGMIVNYRFQTPRQFVLTTKVSF